jgi:hypothetical protein
MDAYSALTSTLGPAALSLADADHLSANLVMKLQHHLPMINHMSAQIPRSVTAAQETLAIWGLSHPQNTNAAGANSCGVSFLKNCQRTDNSEQ